MASVDVPVALLGYGTVGAAVNRLLTESADDIERATGHRLRVVKALVRDPGKEREYPPAGGVLTERLREIADDPSIAVVAEVMGGLEPAGELRARAAAARQARRHREQAAGRAPRRRAVRGRLRSAGVQLRFEASVCAAIPVIKVLRESLVVTNVHRVLGIVNGTTNFVLTEMERGESYDEALAEAQARGFAEADPTDDVSGADAAAKMAILATVAFNSRVELDDVDYSGITTIDPLDVAAARELDMVIRLVGAARLVDGHVDVRVQPALVDQQHPLAKVDGAFNAVMLQGDAIREITLEGPGAGGIETASAVVADIASVIGTMGTGFLQNDAAWRSCPGCRRATADRRSTSACRRGPARRARARRGGAGRARDLDRTPRPARERRRRSPARRHTRGARGRARRMRSRRSRRAARGARPVVPLPVVSDRGVTELGWA